MGWVQGFSKIKYVVMLNKVKKTREQTTVRKIPENVQLKHIISKRVYSSFYEMIWGTVETDATSVANN